MSAWARLSDYITTWANWTGDAGILHRLQEHLALTAVSVAIAAAVVLLALAALMALCRPGTRSVAPLS